MEWESCSDSDSNDDGLEIGRHGHGDEDIVINTEHASKEVDAEGDGEAEAVAGVDEGMNSCLGRILPRREGEGDESGDEEESNNNEKGAEWSFLGVRGKRSREGNSHQNLKMRGEELRDPYYDDEKCER